MRSRNVCGKTRSQVWIRDSHSEIKISAGYSRRDGGKTGWTPLSWSLRHSPRVPNFRRPMNGKSDSQVQQGLNEPSKAELSKLAISLALMFVIYWLCSA